MATGTYFTTAAPAKVEELMAQWETRIRIGKQSLYGSLETSSATYTNYEASIGLVDAQAFDIGLVESLGLEITVEKEEYEAANVLSSGIFFVTEESAVLSVGVKQFDPRILRLCVSNGIMYEMGNERLITVGAATGQEVTRPLEISSTNVFQFAPAAPTDTETGVTSIVTTIYDAEVTSGLPWGDIVAGELNTLDLEFQARSVSAREKGNRLLSFYIF